MTDTVVRIGFLPLVDSAILIAAAELGFAADAGLRLELSREASWANIRDKLVYRHFDAAHMLAGLPIAATLGLSRAPTPLLAPFSLGLNGNAVTLAARLAVAIEVWQGAALDPDRPADTARTLAAEVARRRTSGEPALRFGIVHRFSSHNYILRYWLAFAGIDPDRDVQLTIVPPPLMADALAADELDGFIVGEPWSSVAVAAGTGRIVALGSRIWQRGVEKVLGVRADWAATHADTLGALLRALDRAAAWCGDGTNCDTLAALLARPAYLDKPAGMIAACLSGQLPTGSGAVGADPDFLVLYKGAANFPWVSHALWLYSQMVRWDQVVPSAVAEAAVRGVFRPDLYRRAIGGSATPLPGANAKVEGALAVAHPVGSLAGRLSIGPDRFFDNRWFDPDHLDDYLAGLRDG